MHNHHANNDDFGVILSLHAGPLMQCHRFDFVQLAHRIYCSSCVSHTIAQGLKTTRSSLNLRFIAFYRQIGNFRRQPVLHLQPERHGSAGRRFQTPHSSLFVRNRSPFMQTAVIRKVRYLPTAGYGADDQKQQRH